MRSGWAQSTGAVPRHQEKVRASVRMTPGCCPAEGVVFFWHVPPGGAPEEDPGHTRRAGRGKSSLFFSIKTLTIFQFLSTKIAAVAKFCFYSPLITTKHTFQSSSSIFFFFFFGIKMQTHRNSCSFEGLRWWMSTIFIMTRCKEAQHICTRTHRKNLDSVRTHRTRRR